MKIAQIAPLTESVPPKTYGGTERIVSYLTEELVAQGHEVTLFASGDSQTSAELVPCAPQALRLANVRDAMPHNLLQLEHVRKRLDGFDMLHFHSDYLHFQLVRMSGCPAVTTMHGRLDLTDYPPLFDEYGDMPLVSISNQQRRPLAANWVSTVYHGLPADLYDFAPAGSNGYLAFLGRLCPDKRPDRAIEIAARAGHELKIAAKVDKVDEAYFEARIRPLLDNRHVEFIGEIGEHEKRAFLGGAKALLFPIDWPEPFGLTMIEAMACGTPVIAWPHGSVPEVIEHGISGYIVNSIDAAVHAVDAIGALDRRKVRAAFDARFTAPRMAADYVRLYKAQLRLAKRAMLHVA
jgi:glycosyltransferase involved in cell wall biosynthesis